MTRGERSLSSCLVGSLSLLLRLLLTPPPAWLPPIVGPSPEAPTRGAMPVNEAPSIVTQAPPLPGAPTATGHGLEESRSQRTGHVAHPSLPQGHRQLQRDELNGLQSANSMVWLRRRHQSVPPLQTSLQSGY